MASLTITMLYAGVLGLVLLGLTVRVVVKARVGANVPYGDGGKSELTPVVRAQANFIEYVPMAVLLMALIEYHGTSSTLMHGLGIALVVGRLLHAIGLRANTGPTFGRLAGSALTWLVIAIAAVVAIMRYFGSGTA